MYNKENNSFLDHYFLQREPPNEKQKLRKEISEKREKN